MSAIGHPSAVRARIAWSRAFSASRSAIMVIGVGLLADLGLAIEQAGPVCQEMERKRFGRLGRGELWFGLRILRRSYRLLQATVARVLGISVAGVSRLETGQASGRQPLTGNADRQVAGGRYLVRREALARLLGYAR